MGSDQQEPAPPKPVSHPVMDIKAPPRAASGEPVKAPPEDSSSLPDSVLLEKKASPAAKPPKSPNTPSGSGVGLAIFATVIIVLGLGVLFVYAYLYGAR